MLNKPFKSRGVTLIELLIGLAIVGILLTMGLPSISTWMQNTQLRNAAEAIQSGLQLARGEAVKRNNFVSFVVMPPDSSWSVDVVNPAETLQFRTSAEGSPNAQVAATDNIIIFNGLGKTDLAATATFSITNPTGGACKAGGGNMTCLNVTVSVGGQIKMCDPAVVTAGDSRAC